jgi:HSP20 family protein
MVQIVRRQPLSPFDELRAEMDRLFHGLVVAPLAKNGSNGTNGRPSAPRLDLELVETEAALVVRADVPGIDPEKIEVTVLGDRLILSGEKQDPLAQEGEARRYCERDFGPVQREIVLPVSVDPAAVTAQHAHGVLTVTLPKADAARPRRIAIQAS